MMWCLCLVEGDDCMEIIECKGSSTLYVPSHSVLIASLGALGERLEKKRKWKWNLIYERILYLEYVTHDWSQSCTWGIGW